MAGGAGEPVGSARLELVSGVALLREEDAVLEAMLAGWAKQQAGGRGLSARTVGQRQAVVRQFLDHAGEYPWNWTAAHLDEWSADLVGVEGKAKSTIRNYLVRQLLARRRGRAAVGRTSDHPWLFPGGAPAHPISTAQLKTRLAAVGIHGRSGRNTALMDLAVKLPPVALARMLGIHINTAGTWAERAGGPHAAYAAQVSRRAFSKF